MEERKFLKKKWKALNGSNKKYLAEACLELGEFYNRNVRYEDALKQYEESALIYCELNMKLENAQSNRMIGEMYMFLSDFEKALEYENIYLSIAHKLGNRIEEQRAYATLGRAHLLQGQSFDDLKLSKKSLKAALKAFTKSLELCECLKGKINNHEFMDMRARLLLNIGVVSEHLDYFERANQYFQQAISICKREDLHDLLSQCYITEGLFYSTKQSYYAKAINCFNYAYEVASRLENKNTKQSEILVLKADILCKISDFQSAKMVLTKAWKLNSATEPERCEIERNLKIIAALCYTEDSLITTNSYDFKELKRLYETLGDGSCSLKNYEKAIKSYLKMLEHAEKSGEAGKELVPIYVSLYQTYKDTKDYAKAIEYIELEYDVVKNNPKEAFATLLNLAETLHLAEKPIEEVEAVYLKAKIEAQKDKNEKHEAKCVKLHIKYLVKQKYFEKATSLEKELSLMKYRNINIEESSEEECEETPNIGEEICLDDLTDFSENEESNDVNTKTTRKRGKTLAIKKNAKGETQLHQACISGSLAAVTRLISLGHPINVRDNAGWLPIHEACIHGRKKVLEILIKNGAHINDRGGTQCDGITPLYDAASNGHLDIIDMLLNNGASPAIKSDYGDTPLNVLIKWRKDATIEPSDHIFYETLCARMQKNLEMLGNSPVKIGNASFSRSLQKVKANFSKSNRSASEICYISESDIERSHSPKFKSKSRKIIDDSSDSSNSSESSDSDSKAKKNDSNVGVNEYKYAMSALRNKRFAHSDSSNDKVKNRNQTKRTALLTENEIDDDWLENDIQNHTKKRRQSNDIFNPSKRKSNESTRITPKTVAELNYQRSSRSALHDFNSFQENIPPSNSSLRSKLPLRKNFDTPKLSRKWKHQSSLTKAGFSRKKTDRPRPLSPSYDFESDTDGNSNMSNRSNKEPDSTSELSLMEFNKHTSSNISIPSQDYSNVSIMKQTSMQLVGPTTAFRVRIQDKLFLIPVSLDRINWLKINWLSREASRRYYNIEGVEPILHLLTNDGAILADDDPLNILIGSAPLQANIISWNLPPLVDAYIERCSQFDVDVDNHIKMKLEASQATHIVDLSNLNLSFNRIKPVFRSLNHQSNLKSLMLSNNNLGNAGMKSLVQCLPSLRNIAHLNLKNNSIKYEGLQELLNMFERSKNPICQYFQYLDISFNTLDDLGLICIAKLTKYVKFKQLNLRACNINYTTVQHLEELNFQFIENLDLSMNSISKEVIKQIFECINTELLSVIKLEGIDLSKSFVSTLLDMGLYLSLTHIDISRCNIRDSDIPNLLRSASNCVNLRTICLRYNTELTFLSLKKFLQHPNLTHVYFEGCPKVFKYLNKKDLQTNLLADCDRKLEAIHITPEGSSLDIKDIIMLFSNMWRNYWEHKAKVKKLPYNGIIFTKM